MLLRNLIALTFLLTGVVVDSEGQVKKWEIFEISLTAKTDIKIPMQTSL
jgi:hypothetical protein